MSKSRLLGAIELTAQNKWKLQIKRNNANKDKKKLTIAKFAVK